MSLSQNNTQNNTQNNGENLKPLYFYFGGEVQGLTSDKDEVPLMSASYAMVMTQERIEEIMKDTSVVLKDPNYARILDGIKEKFKNKVYHITENY